METSSDSVKIVILGDKGSGKTTLVNCLRDRPMKVSGAAAGYCVYNERLELDETQQMIRL